ncbi:MAG: DHH family phosphoesterase, partial [Erysipelotrichaceae bacterium]|nr:DHH family phosphoesterase [Erysipelotrichaceae bacterium]
MTKKVAQWRNLIISLLILEILVAVGLYTFLTSMLFLVLMVYIIGKNILIFISLAILTNILDSETQSVAEALDVDSRNALVFGGVGLIQYDENYNITWVSDLLVALNVRIVGVKLLEWQPTLASLFENDEIRIVELKGRKFEVYNSEETRLLFLKDVTQYVSMKQDYDDQQMCVGYITIDNYEETLNNVDEEKMSQIRTQARHIINEWATSNGMIIRSYRTGGYLLFFNERIYAKQVENKFAILNTFKDEMAKFDEVMTLSIGIGRGTRVLRELEQMATQALNLTYSRGGDQVAIKSGKDKVRYFGGTTESVGKSSKVRTRVIAQTLSG